VWDVVKTLCLTAGASSLLTSLNWAYPWVFLPLSISLALSAYSESTETSPLSYQSAKFNCCQFKIFYDNIFGLRKRAFLLNLEGGTYVGN